MVSCERFGESAGGLEGDFLEHEDGDGGSDGEPEDDEGAGEAVVGEQIHIVAEHISSETVPLYFQSKPLHLDVIIVYFNNLRSDSLFSNMFT